MHFDDVVDRHRRRGHGAVRLSVLSQNELRLSLDVLLWQIRNVVSRDPDASAHGY